MPQQLTPNANSGIRPYRSPHGAPQVRYFTESTAASTATIVAGQVVSVNTVVSSGGQRIVRAPSSGGTGGNLLEIGVTSIVGVAMQTSTSDGSTRGLSLNGISDYLNEGRKIGVWVADHETEFIGYLKGNTPADSSLIGRNLAVIFDSTLKLHMIDSTNSTAALVAVRITDVPDPGIGDTNGAVVFKFLSSNLMLVS